MIYLSKNLKEFRLKNNLTQVDVAEYLNITPQSVSKWERGETYPDITFLPALANIFETSIDLLIGMDNIKSEKTRYDIHDKANRDMRDGKYDLAEKVYRDALNIYPKDPEMILGLASVLALTEKYEEAIMLIEKGLPLSSNVKQESTMRAVLVFLYLKKGDIDISKELTSFLPHTRESREVIMHKIEKVLSKDMIDKEIKNLILGE